MTATAQALELVILVDKNDMPIGTAEKLAAHQQNLLHRAFSVFIFRSKNDQLVPDFLTSLRKHPSEWELLLQQRALEKYHSPGLWTNTCCSHPRPDEDIMAAGERRLQEELGIQASLTSIGWFHYNAHFANGLAENENDHVLIGVIPADTAINPAPHEIHATRWVSIPDLQQEFLANPAQFTPWFQQALGCVLG